MKYVAASADSVLPQVNLPHCTGACGMILSVDQDDRIAAIRPDRDHPVSRGFACFKGLHSHQAHNSPDRLLHPLKRGPDGRFAPIPLEQALDEIAGKLRALRDSDGTDSMGVFRGTAANFSHAACHMAEPFLDALGCTHYYSPTTIEQSAKQVSFERMGGWAGGQGHLEQFDCLILFGCNPVVSLGVYTHVDVDPVRRLRRARERGMTRAQVIDDWYVY